MAKPDDVQTRIANAYVRGFRAAVGSESPDCSVLDGWDAEDTAYVCGYNSGARSIAAAKRRAKAVAKEVTS